MKKQKFEKWEREVRTIDYEMRDLRSFRRDARVFRWMERQHQGLFADGSIFASHVFEGEQAYFFMAVRRLVRPQGNATSLVGLLASFVALYPLAKERFPRLPAATEITADRERLVTLTAPVMEFVDRAVAHTDPNADYDLWESGMRLVPSINLTIETASKYVDACTDPYVEVGGHGVDDLRDLYGRQWVREGTEIPAELLE
jgi:hypothetical protein